MPIEIGCCGFWRHSVISFLSKIDITGLCLKSALPRFQTKVQHASSWILSQSKQKNKMHVTQNL